MKNRVQEIACQSFPETKTPGALWSQKIKRVT